MDLVKIGKYIAAKRKELGLTQRQVAEELGMSDKSVSKWERGICLPDVSVYSDLCMILGITLNEFLAGEDVPAESIIKKSEENIIGVATDSKHKQLRLKRIIRLLLIVSIAAISIIGIWLVQSLKPLNYIDPVAKDSTEMKTIETLSATDGAFMCHYASEKEFDSLHLIVTKYHSGELISKEPFGFTYTDVGSPKNGTILIVPDLETFSVKIILADEDCKMATSIPLLEDVEDRYHYGRSTICLDEKTDITYGKEQALAALIFDNDEMWVPGLQDLLEGTDSMLAYNDYVFLFSVEFVENPGILSEGRSL